MNDYLAGMIARSEHKHMQQTLPLVRDFDLRGQSQPRWAARMIGRLFQSAGRMLTHAGVRISREPHTRPVPQPGTPLSDQC